jgi:hypothetical protein
VLRFFHIDWSLSSRLLTVAALRFSLGQGVEGGLYIDENYLLFEVLVEKRKAWICWRTSFCVVGFG